MFHFRCLLVIFLIVLRSNFYVAVYFVDTSLWLCLLNGSSWWLESKLKLTKMTFFNITLLPRASAHIGLSVTPASYPTISIK